MIRRLLCAWIIYILTWIPCAFKDVVPEEWYQGGYVLFGPTSFVQVLYWKCQSSPGMLACSFNEPASMLVKPFWWMKYIQFNSSEWWSY